jgi:cytidylate kinase
MTYDYLPDNTGIYLNKKPTIDLNYLIKSQVTNYVVCIDGLAGSGKSTLGKRLSKTLNIPHISSGIFYRVFTYIICVYHIEFTPSNIDKIAKDISFEIVNKEFNILYKNNKVPMTELKNDVIDSALNRYSADIYFRSSMSKQLVNMVKQLQHSFVIDLRGANPEYVLEIEKQNRPIIRILLVADTETKAQRRLLEYLGTIYSKDAYYKTEEHKQELLVSIRSKIVSRDLQDIESIKKTNIGLIHKTSGVIDSTGISEEKVGDLALNFTQQSLQKRNFF